MWTFWKIYGSSYKSFERCVRFLFAYVWFLVERLSVIRFKDKTKKGHVQFVVQAIRLLCNYVGYHVHKRSSIYESLCMVSYRKHPQRFTKFWEPYSRQNTLEWFRRVLSSYKKGVSSSKDTPWCHSTVSARYAVFW